MQGGSAWLSIAAISATVGQVPLVFAPADRRWGRPAWELPRECRAAAVSAARAARGAALTADRKFSLGMPARLASPRLGSSLPTKLPTNRQQGRSAVRLRCPTPGQAKRARQMPDSD
jgi:hypothetical protein